MSGCEVYQIRALERFKDSYDLIIRKHYSKRKQKHNKEFFEEQVSCYIEQLSKTPRAAKLNSLEGIPKAQCNVEGFPHSVISEKLEFWKVRFTPIGSSGAARWGRLMYVIYEGQRIIYLIWLYTHDEFGGRESRPVDKELRYEFELINKQVEEMEIGKHLK